MMKIIQITLASLSLVLLVGCGSTVAYKDPVYSNPISTDFTYSDLDHTANAMVDSLLKSANVIGLPHEKRPLLVVDRIRNETDQHINTEAITDSIRTDLIRSGRFTFTDKASRAYQKEELEYQNYSGMVDPREVVAMGQQLGAEYMVTGNISSFEERGKGNIRKAYKFNLNLINLKTGIIEWTDELPIGKEWKRGFFGS